MFATNQYCMQHFSFFSQVYEQILMYVYSRKTWNTDSTSLHKKKWTNKCSKMYLLFKNKNGYLGDIPSSYFVQSQLNLVPY